MTIGFMPVLSLAAVLTRDLVNPAPCVGIAVDNILGPGGIGEIEYQGFGVVGIDGSDPKYEAESSYTYSAADLCGQTVNGQVVTCIGDITQTCAGYGVATYNSLSCRTICPDIGDPTACWRSDSGSANEFIVGVIICDMTM